MVQGVYQRIGQSDQFAARLEIDAGGRVRCREAGEAWVGLNALEISPRIGNSRRYINFPDGSCFETDDNDTVDRWLEEHGHTSQRGMLLHRLESAGKFVAVTAVITVLMGFVFVRWGVPWLSEKGAYALPANVSEAIGSGTLEILDAHLLEPSRLPPERQAELRRLFGGLGPTGSAFMLRLELRGGALVGANAFALPDGTVVLTDELVAAARDEDEIAGVMLHEIGHVEHRHGLRRALQSVGLATILVVLAGDISAANSLVVTLPAFLVETRYSRAMETEADLYAARSMMEAGRDPMHLIRFLGRLESGGENVDETTGRLGYLSTHPLGRDRLRPVEALIREQEGRS